MKNYRFRVNFVQMLDGRLELFRRCMEIRTALELVNFCFLVILANFDSIDCSVVQDENFVCSEKEFYCNSDVNAFNR